MAVYPPPTAQLHKEKTKSVKYNFGFTFWGEKIKKNCHKPLCIGKISSGCWREQEMKKRYALKLSFLLNLVSSRKEPYSQSPLHPCTHFITL